MADTEIDNKIEIIGLDNIKAKLEGGAPLALKLEGGTPVALKLYGLAIIKYPCEVNYFPMLIPHSFEYLYEVKGAVQCCF